MKREVTAWALCSLMTLAGCEGEPATQTVVRFVAVDDLVVPPGSTLSLEIWGDGIRQDEVGQERGPVPFSPDTQLVVDARDGDAARRFTVFAELLGPSGARLSWARVRTGFVAGALSEVRVHLASGCFDPSDRPDVAPGYDALTSCGSHDTCLPVEDGGGQCASPCYEPEPFETALRPEASAPVSCPDSDCRAIERLEIGWDNSCVLDEGEVFCWGRTGFSDGDTRWKRPSRVLSEAGLSRPDLEDPIVDLAIHIYHVCVLLESGVVRCGGRDNTGNLGVTTSGYARCCTVAPEPPPPPFSSLITGGGWVAGLTKDEGAIWYTGAEPVRGGVDGESVPPYRPFRGQTGFEVIYPGRNFLAGFEGGVFRWFDRTTAPALVREDEAVIESAGKTVCAISLAGELRCWGETTERQDYTDEPRDFGPGWRDIALSKYQDSGEARRRHHRCGVREDGSLRCWGTNDDGQLGVDPSEAVAVPEGEYVEPFAGVWSDWEDVTVGRAHTCGIRAGGEVFCWGANEASQLGVTGPGGAEPRKLCIPAF